MNLHFKTTRQIPLKDLTIETVPVFDDAAQALLDGAYVYKLFDFVMSLTYISKGSRPKGYVSPDELPDEENPYYYGKIIFDTDNNWVYEGCKLAIADQEKIVGAMLSRI